MNESISAEFPFELKRLSVADAEMAFIDVGEGDPIVFLHGNPTSSYLWRNVIPHVQSLGRCLAPDLIGMGHSSVSPTYCYRFSDHAKYLDSWFEQLSLRKKVILVVHDWGAALGFDWAARFPASVEGIVYMEAMVRPRMWTDMPPERQAVFKRLRGSDGIKMVLEDNFFVEKMLFEHGVIRNLSDEEKDIYRRPFKEPGVSRLPTLLWPREIVFDGEPPDVYARVKRYSDWLSTSLDVPKLFINAEEGHGTAGAAREFCRTWPNQKEISLKARHYVPEDCPHEIGEALAEFVRTIRN
ncbi:haloalkane dehalogenase [Paraburkholderia largidicola]|uniref:Haloalkane dehalogenase n=1 Tax=Paraburkholderia largidicola TaxID=3014751 RepID=A0A7I8C3X4_9BURK|nr:haloalkane dehalogenase [Paraburkholderia sp. PGU16]